MTDDSTWGGETEGVPRDVDGIVHFCVELIFKDDKFLWLDSW